MRKFALPAAFGSCLALALAPTSARAQVMTLNCKITVFDENHAAVQTLTVVITIDRARSTVNGKSVTITNQGEGVSWRGDGFAGGFNARTGEYRNTNLADGKIFVHSGTCAPN